MLTQLLLNALIYIVPFIILMIVVVGIHEWGHYYAGRIIGVHAREFAIGMGPTLFGRKDKNNCHWQLKAIPIGGYVRFRSEEDENTPIREQFDKRGPGDRAFVIAAGPAINLLFGMVLIAGLYAINGRPFIPPIITDVVAEMPAEKAGILAGDRILSINGTETKSFTDVSNLITMHLESPMRIEVDRDGHRHLFNIYTERVEINSLGGTFTVGQIGIRSENPVQYQHITPSEAIIIGAQDVVRLTYNLGVTLGQMITGQRSVQEMGGPVRIAEMSGEAIRLDIQMFVFLVAAISINLGIMNLLPLPILDGGQLLLCVMEKIFKKPVPEHILAQMYKAGAAFLVFVIVVLAFNDIMRIAQRIWL